MNRNQILLLIVIGQGLVIALIFSVRFKRESVEPDDSVGVVQVAEPMGSLPEGAQESTLAEALTIARQGLTSMRAELIDYRGRVVKRERIQGQLAEESEMEIKVQCRRLDKEEVVQPMRVYLKFLRPRGVAGREVIWAEDQNDGRLIAHEPGLLNVAQASLDPRGERAMDGNLYPITEIGLFNLVEQLIARGEEDLQESQVRVTLAEGQMIGDRECQQIRIELIQPHDELNFEYAEIFIDSQRQIPLRYAAYGWPGETTTGDGDAASEVLEEYTYYDIETNVGLTDADFDPSNETYDFPAFRVNL
ncbi:hypothetical protein Poly24_50080 [Rosistilla carotiformis]|uniref:DUF1571 domain-containing protein n=1 Tax=Rosistilla carotiformis TaxID=2528017 RepID=A0A518K0D7_9BACT|nr:DUF1571 domain-containing protein [Rosistilla carotiformis]QDV71273.1 hypothetical protein Poly24_50080 [Rosistilla carotiformis]